MPSPNLSSAGGTPLASRLAPLAAATLALASACAQETIVHQQEEREAIGILVLLDKNGIRAEKVRSEGSRELRFDITVAGSDAAPALSVLDKHDLPKTRRPGTEGAFGGGGMIPTAEQELAKRIVGIEGDIVNSLRQIPRVISVEALVSIPEDDPLRPETEERPKPKASVTLVYLQDASGTPPVSVEEVQRHVQAKLPEMRSKEVNVLLLPSGGEGEPGGDGGDVAAGAPAIDPSLGCVQKERVLGIDVCQGNRGRVLSWIIGAITLSGIMAAVAVLSVLRLLRYRRDFTRLTAQFQQLSK